MGTGWEVEWVPGPGGVGTGFGWWVVEWVLQYSGQSGHWVQMEWVLGSGGVGTSVPGLGAMLASFLFCV